VDVDLQTWVLCMIVAIHIGQYIMEFRAQEVAWGELEGNMK
jgi:hypothetical protein